MQHSRFLNYQISEFLIAGVMAEENETNLPSEEEYNRLHQAYTDFLIKSAGDGEGNYRMDYEITVIVARKTK